MDSRPRSALSKGGSIISGEALRLYTARQGLCPICARSKTHARRGNLFSKTWAPLTEKRGDEYMIYNGYCLQPTCYTLAEAQLLSGDVGSSTSSFTRAPLSPKAPKAFRKRSPRTTVSRGIATAHSTGALTRSTQGSSQSSLDRVPTSPLSRAKKPMLELEAPKEQDVSSTDKVTWKHENAFFSEARRGEYKGALLQERQPQCQDSTSVQSVTDAAYRGDSVQILQILERCDYQRSPDIIGACWVQLANNCQITVTSLLEHDHWVDVIMHQFKNSANASSPLVADSLKCLATLAASSGVLANILIAEKNVIQAILDVSSTQQAEIPPSTAGVCDYSCEALEALLGFAKEIPYSHQLLHWLVLHATAAGPRSDYAVRGLFHIFNKMWSDKPIDATAYSSLMKESTLVNIWRKAESSNSSPLVIEAALYLLWELSNTKPITINEANLSLLLTSMSQHENIFLLDAALGLLTSATLSLGKTEPGSVWESIALVVCHTMHIHQKEETLQVKGLFVLLKHMEGQTSVCAPVYAAISKACMSACNFVNKPAVQALSGKVLTVAMDHVEENSPLLDSQAAAWVAQLLRTILRDFKAHHPATEAAKEAVIWLIVKMSGHPGIAGRLLYTNIILQLDVAMTQEQDQRLGVAMQRIVVNLLAVSLESVPSPLPLFETSVVSVSLIKHCLKLATTAQTIPTVCRDCCLLLATLYASIPFSGTFGQDSTLPLHSCSGKLHTHTHEELSMILEVMAIHPDDETIQHAGCLAFTNFFSPVCSKSLSPENQEAIRCATKNVFPTLLHALERHGSHATILLNIFSGLLVLVKVGDPQDLRVWSSSLLGAAADTLECHGHVELQTKVMTLLKDILMRHEAVTDAAVTQLTRCLLDCIVRGQDPAVVENALNHLDSVTNQYPHADEQFIASLEVIPCMLKELSQCTAQTCNRERINSIFQLLVQRQRHDICETLVERGGVEIIMESLDETENQTVLASSCHILSGLMPYITHAAFTRSCIDVYPKIRKIIGSACSTTAYEGAIQLFLSISSRCEVSADEEQWVELLPHILRSMASNLDCLALLTVSCKAIRQIARIDPGFAQSFQATKIPSLLVDSLLVHHGCADFVLEGLLALKTLFTNQVLCDIVDVDAVEASLLGLVHTHLSLTQVVAEGISTLNNFVVSDSEGTVAPLGDGVLDTILLAMRRHPSDFAVQECACRLVKNYTYSDSKTIRELTSRSEDLLPLLFEAAAAFPSECGASVQYVIHKL